MCDDKDDDDPLVVFNTIDDSIVSDPESIKSGKVPTQTLDIRVANGITFELLKASCKFLGKWSLDGREEFLSPAREPHFIHRAEPYARVLRPQFASCAPRF